MDKYRVELVRVDSFVTYVDANNKEEATYKALTGAPPLRYANWSTLEEFYGDNYNVDIHGETAKKL